MTTSNPTLAAALHDAFFAPSHSDGEYSAPEAEAIRALYPELGGHVTPARVLAAVAKHGDRRCQDGAAASARKAYARAAMAAMPDLYTGSISRGHGLTDYPAV